jgi:hypothetical protein
MIYTVTVKNPKHCWCAKITGLCNKYGLAREFRAKTIVDGNKVSFVLGDGIYEIQIAKNQQYAITGKKPRYFIQVAGDQSWPLSKLAVLEAIDIQTKEAEEEINGRIARFNSEGGFSNN